MLADAAAEAVDFVTMHFLLKDALKQLKEGENLEEKERRWMEQVKAMTELSRRARARGGRGGSVDFLMVRGYDVPGKGPALALRSLVRRVPFLCRQA